MAIRLNYTGRAKINTEDARFRLRTDGGHTTFDATLRLHDYHIAESDARVWVEAYHRTTLMRFDFGRAGLVAPPAERRLTLFPDPNTVLFRVKVTSTSAADAGKLLAEADGLKPRRPDEKDEDRIPLLPVRQGLLGAELWRVEYTGAGESPELVINAAAAEDWKALARDSWFIPLVAPAATRAILTKLAIVERAKEWETEGHWHNTWWRFVTSLPGIGDDFEIDGEADDGETDNGDVADWIDDVVRAFAQQANALQTFIQAPKATA